MAHEYVFKSFNTRRLYTAAGQRIGWTILSTGNVYMYDVDRMVDYILCPVIGQGWSNTNVLNAYDYAREAQAKYNRAEFEEAQAVQRQVIAAARQAPALPEKTA